MTHEDSGNDYVYVITSELCHSEHFIYFSNISELMKTYKLKLKYTWAGVLRRFHLKIREFYMGKLKGFIIIHWVIMRQQ